MQQTKAKTQAQPVSEVNETIKMINEQIKKALAEGNIETASKLTNMITQLTNPQAKPVVEETNEEEIPEDVQEVQDVTEDSDNLEI